MDEKSEKLLGNVNKILREEGLSLQADKEDSLEMIQKYAMPALHNLKEIQASLYNEFFVGSKGPLGKLKGKVIGKIANVSRNTVELALMRQQKFNDNVVTILEYLVEENKRLKEEAKKK